MPNSEHYDSIAKENNDLVAANIAKNKQRQDAGSKAGERARKYGWSRVSPFYNDPVAEKAFLEAYDQK